MICPQVQAALIAAAAEILKPRSDLEQFSPKMELYNLCETFLIEQMRAATTLYLVGTENVNG